MEKYFPQQSAEKPSLTGTNLNRDIPNYTVNIPDKGQGESVSLLPGMSRRHLYITVLIYFLMIAVAEIITAYFDPKTGIIIHGILMFAMFGHASFIYPTNKDLANLLMCIGLAPLIRIISLCTPLSSFSYIYWFLVLSIPLFSGILVVRAIQALSEDAIGLVFNIRKLHWEVIIVVFGFPMGIIEYWILEPESIINELTLQKLIAPALIMIICTGLIEELIFRGLIQFNAIRVFGTWIGILLTSALFGFLHTGNLNVVSVFFAFAVGFVYSLIRLRTGSIIGISLSHGILNCMLFLIMPLDPF